MPNATFPEQERLSNRNPERWKQASSLLLTGSTNLHTARFTPQQEAEACASRIAIAFTLLSTRKYRGSTSPGPILEMAHSASTPLLSSSPVSLA
jgi:hypothetical protein